MKRMATNGANIPCFRRPGVFARHEAERFTILVGGAADPTSCSTASFHISLITFLESTIPSSWSWFYSFFHHSSIPSLRFS
jgi:hypothetical protein